MKFPTVVSHIHRRIIVFIDEISVQDLVNEKTSLAGLLCILDFSYTHSHTHTHKPLKYRNNIFIFIIKYLLENAYF